MAPLSCAAWWETYPEAGRPLWSEPLDEEVSLWLGASRSTDDLRRCPKVCVSAKHVIGWVVTLHLCIFCVLHSCKQRGETESGCHITGHMFGNDTGELVMLFVNTKSVLFYQGEWVILVVCINRIKWHLFSIWNKRLKNSKTVELGCMSSRALKLS